MIGVNDLDPELASALDNLASRGVSLDAKTVALLELAVDAAATTLYVPGIREHMADALDSGATTEEVMEVLELTATLGIHACNVSVPILLDELRSRGIAPTEDLDARQEAVKAEFTRKRGYWNDFWREMLLLDVEFFAAYTEFSSVPWTTGPLAPKVKEFVYIAFDASPTHLYSPGLRQHIRNALDYGASPREVLDVIEIASRVGLHTLEISVPVLAEEVAAP